MALVKRNSKLLGATLGFGVVACGGGDTTCVGGHDSEGACAGDIEIEAVPARRSTGAGQFTFTRGVR